MLKIILKLLTLFLALANSCEVLFIQYRGEEFRFPCYNNNIKLVRKNICSKDVTDPSWSKQEDRVGGE